MGAIFLAKKNNKRRRGRLRNSHKKRQVTILLLQRDGRNCHWCGQWMTWTMAREGYTTPQTDITIDHVLSLNDGGGNDDDNLVLSCRACNEARGLESQRVALSERATSRGDRRPSRGRAAVNPSPVTVG